jgi:hypothetical protein
MNRLIKKSALLLIMIVLCGNATAQPKPWTFGENVVISPNLYTGTMQLAIPFYTYKDADFEIPVTFGYSSSGCVANVRGGIMGPGWGVNVGGMITREIKGIPDETIIMSNVIGNLFSKGIYGFHKLHKANTSESISAIMAKLFRVFGFADKRCFSSTPDYLSPSIVYSPSGNIRYDPKPDNVYLYDAEPDIYHFNFMGYSGSFHLGLNDSIHVYNTNIDSKNLKVEIEYNNSSTQVNHFVSNAFIAINIYTPDGYKYVFNCDIDSSNVAYSVLTGYFCETEFKYNRAIAWYLTEIVSPTGRTVTFDYENRQIISYNPAYIYTAGTYYSHVYGLSGSIGAILGLNGICIKEKNIYKAINDNEHSFSKNETYMPFIKTIAINNENTAITEIKFNEILHYPRGQYRAFETSIHDINDESLKLGGIVVNSKLNSTTTKVKECSLMYKLNNNGAQEYYLDNITIHGEGVYAMDYYKWNDYSYPYSANGTFSVDHWGYYNGKNNDADTSRRFLAVTSLNANLDETLTTNYRNHNT